MLWRDGAQDMLMLWRDGAQDNSNCWYCCCEHRHSVHTWCSMVRLDLQYVAMALDQYGVGGACAIQLAVQLLHLTAARDKWRSSSRLVSCTTKLPCSLLPCSLLPCSQLPCSQLPCSQLPCSQLPCFVESPTDAMLHAAMQGARRPANSNSLHAIVRGCS